MENRKIGDRLSIARLDEAAYDHLSQGGFEHLNIVNGGELWPDLHFLIPYKNKVRKLTTIGAFQTFNGLDQLTELVNLNLSDQIPSPVFDFSPLAKLESCSLEWSRKMDGAAFFSLPELRDVSIYRYKATDFSQIGLSKSLRSLELRYGRVDSLKGIEGCVSLEKLHLINLKGLLSLDGIEACRALKTLEINGGALSDDVSASLRKLSNLEEILLYSDKVELLDLDWLVLNPGMRILRTECMVRNVDWNLLFASPRLYEITITHLPGSLPSDEELMTISRQHGKTIERINHSGTKRSPWVTFQFVGHTRSA